MTRGNELVRAALHKFNTHPEVLAASRALKTPEDRFAAIQDADVKTSEDTTYFDYFGYSNKVRVPLDSKGKPGISHYTSCTALPKG